MTTPDAIWRRTAVLGITGALAFWLANFAISLTPIAAEYRASLGIDYAPMLLAALIGGLVVGFTVSYVLLRFYGRVPTKGPITKSVVLSLIALVALELVVEIPARFSTATSDSLHLFLVGMLFNVVRILALGIAIGVLYERVVGQPEPKAAA